MSTSFLENPIEEEDIDIAHPQIIAWKKKDSFHRGRLQREKLEVNNIREIEEQKLN